MSGCAWVTLATNDTYCLGALVLAHSLKRVTTRHHLAIIITPAVSPSMREQLSTVFDLVRLVDVLDSQDATNLALLERPDLGVTFTKIHCWTLTLYTKCVFLDADTLVMQNCDELMEREELSAAPDPGWPDCFNSGVFVFSPSQDTFNQLVQFASTHGSFDGGDQGLLNMYFNDWPTSDIRKHLSFLYNMCSTSTYTYLPALKYYGANIKIVHFIGANKPWLLGPSGSGMSSFTQAWWQLFQSSVVQHLTKHMTGLAGALGSKEKSAIEDQWRKQNWEQGNVDFTGKDSFENIWQKIMEAVNKPKVEGDQPAEKKVEDKPGPKEIASQAISEKEKADLPEKTQKDSLPEVMGDVTKLVASVPEAATPDKSNVALPASAPAEQHKSPTPTEGKAPLSPLPPLEPPPTSELPTPQPAIEKAADKVESGLTKVPEPPKSPGDVPPLPIVAPLASKEASAPLAVEPPKQEPTSAPIELPKLSEILSGAPSKKEQVAPTVQPQGIVELPKIEDIQKGLEQQLKEQLKQVPKESPIPPALLPKGEVPIPQIPLEQKKVVESLAEAPKSEASIADVPKAESPKAESPKAESPKAEAPKAEAPKAEEPKGESPKAEAPKAEAPKAESPKAEAPKAEAPKAEAPKAEALKTEESKAEAPKVDAKVEKPKPESPKVEIPKTEAPLPIESKADTPKPDVPKGEAPKVPQEPAKETKKPMSPPTDAPLPQLAAVPAEVKEPTKEAAPSDVSKPSVPSEATAEKQKTPPKEQSKEGQKQVKQQAPQPPPKNGKQKKGQPPQPTAAHPLAEAPVPTVPTPLAEEQKVVTPEVLTPPMSPVAPEVKIPEAQPATPIITAPTPPVSPLDAPKSEDPLTAQLEAAGPEGASSSGGVDVPVPPKRKGKGNNNQPQKSQNNGGKGKGKK